MAVFIDDQDALVKLARIEGQAWGLAECADLIKQSPERNSFFLARKRYHEFVAEIEEMDAEELEWEISSPSIGGATIYGADGWNRYFVCWDGSIQYSQHHGSKAKSRNAEAAAAEGFDLYR